MTTINSSTLSKNTKTFGIVTMILGILSILAPMVIGFSISILVGILVLLAGIMRMMWTFQTSSISNDFFGFIFGALTFICGLALVSDPILASGFLSIMLAIYFIFDGIFEIMAAFRLRPMSGWGWLLFAGSTSFLLGLMIWQQYPLSGAWAIGILLGIKLFFVGIIMISVGNNLKSGISN
jgi:uncharacterized membrane protein HdeD (DUF308 family)